MLKILKNFAKKILNYICMHIKNLYTYKIKKRKRNIYFHIKYLKIKIKNVFRIF